MKDMTYGELKKAIGMPDSAPERRTRIYTLAYDQVLRLAKGASHETSTHVAVPVMDLPDGAKVLQVYIDHLYGGFGFVVEHESFDPVPDGVESPHAHGEMKVVELTKKNLQEGDAGKQ